MVAEGRHMDAAKVRSLADGRAYTGRQALKLGLVDEIGGERDARDWLAANKNVSSKLPVRGGGGTGLASRAFRGELAPLLQGLWKILLPQSLNLDGPWALW